MRIDSVLRGLLMALLCGLCGSAVWADEQSDLFFAAKAGNNSRLEKLLEQGLDVNSRDAQGNTPLILAARDENARTVDFLLKHGADPNARDRNGDSALSWTALRGDQQMAESLLAHQADPNQPEWTPLMYAALHAHPAMVALFLQHGAQVDAVSPNASTALMLAAKSGCVSCVKLLLQARADVHKQNENKDRAWDFAKRSNSKQIMGLLQEHGAQAPPAKDAP